MTFLAADVAIYCYIAAFSLVTLCLLVIVVSAASPLECQPTVDIIVYHIQPCIVMHVLPRGKCAHLLITATSCRTELTPMDAPDPVSILSHGLWKSAALLGAQAMNNLPWPKQVDSWVSKLPTSSRGFGYRG